MQIISNNIAGQAENEKRGFFRAPRGKKEKMFFAAIATVVLTVVLILVVFFGDYIGARAIGLSGPRTVVQQGETISLRFLTRQGLMGRGVEICNNKLLKISCKALPFKVNKTATTIDVTIPTNYTLGRADIRLIGIYSNGARIILGVRAVTVQPFVAQNNNDDGSSSFYSEDDSSFSTPTPTPISSI